MPNAPTWTLPRARVRTHNQKFYSLFLYSASRVRTFSLSYAKSMGQQKRSLERRLLLLFQKANLEGQASDRSLPVALVEPESAERQPVAAWPNPNQPALLNGDHAGAGYAGATAREMAYVGIALARMLDAHKHGFAVGAPGKEPPLVSVFGVDGSV